MYDYTQYQILLITYALKNCKYIRRKEIKNEILYNIYDIICQKKIISFAYNSKKYNNMLADFLKCKMIMFFCFNDKIDIISQIMKNIIDIIENDKILFYCDKNNILLFLKMQEKQPKIIKKKYKNNKIFIHIQYNKLNVIITYGYERNYYIDIEKPYIKICIDKEKNGY